MTEDLPEEIDLIVVGSGFTESCVAAAASRVGMSVIHVDPNDYYGGAWASFGLAPFIDILENKKTDEIQNCSYEWHFSKNENIANDDVGAEAIEGSSYFTKEKLLDISRRFSIDLTPKLLYADGALVKLLISSNICRYAEFRAVDTICTQSDDGLISVPCTRSDVFNTKVLSIVEKRLLMKLLNNCVTFREANVTDDEEILEKYKDKTFNEYLKDLKLTEKIKTCVIQAITMCNEETSFEEGMKQIKKFLNCLGRYGNTPFLFTMYGCGEIPQCFCRLCAVFGGIYCLKQNLNDLQINEEKNRVSLILEGKKLSSKAIVFSHGNVPQIFLRENYHIEGYGKLVNNLSRGVYLALSPLGPPEINAGGGGVNILRLVHENREAILIQLSYRSGTCPDGIYLFHITTRAISNQPEEDIRPFRNQVFSETIQFSPDIIFSSYFTITSREPTSNDGNALNEGVKVLCTAAPFFELDYDKSIENAREIFEKIFPNLEFLPRAPDPEEIVVDGEDPVALNEAALAEDLREQLSVMDECSEPMDIDSGIKQ